MHRAWIVILALFAFAIGVVCYLQPPQQQRKPISTEEPIQTIPLRREHGADRGCLNAPPCGNTQPIEATVSDLIWNANRYNRKRVRVSGKPMEIRLRRSPCGNYHYFILVDKQGYHLTVVDYTDTSSALQRQGTIVVDGYYRAELHLLDMCQPSRGVSHIIGEKEKTK